MEKNKTPIAPNVAKTERNAAKMEERVAPMKEKTTPIELNVAERSAAPVKEPQISFGERNASFLFTRRRRTKN